MPATSGAVITKALSYVGIVDDPPGSDNVIFNTDYYGAPVSGNYPWCVTYVWDIFRMCNASDLFYNGGMTASVEAVAQWGANSRLTVPTNSGQYGDLILFKWTGSQYNWDHIGFIVSKDPDGTYHTVEGNTSGPSAGSWVYTKHRTITSEYKMIIRPRYTGSVATWYAKRTGGYTRDSVEGQGNANAIGGTLSGLAYSISAISAIMGNSAGEGGLNPWRWESDDVPNYNEFLSWTPQQAQSHGYGLLGFTPANRYINNANRTLYANSGYGPNFNDRSGLATDGNSQILFYNSEVSANWSGGSNFDYYRDDFANIGIDVENFRITFDEFKSGFYSGGGAIPLEYLTGAFELCYEKPADWAAASSYQNRVNNANYWYTYYTDNPPTPPSPPSRKKKLPLWMMVRPVSFQYRIQYDREGG